MAHQARGVPVVWDPSYEVDIGPHVFPTRKYRLIRDDLLAEGVITDADLRRPTPVSDDDIRLVHTTAYVRTINEDRFTDRERALLEVPFSAELRAAMWLCAGGTLLTARVARERGVGVHLGGGFHHAFPGHGEGFCLINDVAVAIAILRRGQEVGRAVVIDLDVHHGNGTAAIFHGDPTVFTFSMHQTHNYPAVKPPSDLDVGLDDGTGDREYLDRLDEALSTVFAEPGYDLAVYLAGADPYRQDQLGGLGLTIGGLRQRDEMVVGTCRKLGVPVAITLAGGYAIDPADTVEIHCNTVRVAASPPE